MESSKQSQVDDKLFAGSSYSYMGQIPQDGNFGQNVALFLEKSRTFV